jgi:hypothetical protein
MVRAWLKAAANFSGEMSIEVLGQPSVATSLQFDPPDSSESIISFSNPLAQDFWRVMESTLMFRYQFDAFIGQKKEGRREAPFSSTYLTLPAASTMRITS